MNANDWQPIESAPKDGTPVLIGKTGLAVTVGRVLSSGGIWTTYSGYRLPWEPTHWMPLPAPPRTDA